jgi:D-serine deaminase-like pyridoxal phosphate-dependent protein
MSAHETRPPASPALNDIDRRARELASRLEASGHWVSPDGRVKEATAAHILGVTTRTLARWREEGTAPPFVAVGRALRAWYVRVLESKKVHHASESAVFASFLVPWPSASEL